MTPLWTIDELDAQVALALATNYDGAPNDRVRAVPDRRTIRYYTTLGLLDRPAEMRGRTALYGRKHLLQLVAIKRLQSHGLTLAQIQERLLGLTPSALARIAKLPDNGESEPKRSKSERTAFWSEPAADVMEITHEEEESERTIQGIPLADGVILLAQLDRAMDDDDAQAIASAAGPLMKLLTARRLIRPRPERRNV